jgi:transcriptional regulator NrdR family protein
MHCPKCGEESLVKETRAGVKGEIRRSRQCKVCGHRFVTVEGLDVSNIMVAKRRNKVLQQFSRDRLTKSIRKAVVRDLPTSELQEIVNRILLDIFASEELFLTKPEGAMSRTATITSRSIGESVIEALRSKARHRPVAVRYALLFEPTYGVFSDAATFLGWLESHPLGQDGTNDPDSQPKVVVKRDGSVEPFGEKKLRDSVRYAAKKRPDEGATHEDVQFGDEICRQVLSAVRYQRIVTSGQLTAEVMRILRDDPEGSLEGYLDRGSRELAYLRVASTAKSFARVADFATEARGIALRAADPTDNGHVLSVD